MSSIAIWCHVSQHCSRKGKSCFLSFQLMAGEVVLPFSKVFLRAQPTGCSSNSTQGFGGRQMMCNKSHVASASQTGFCHLQLKPVQDNGYPTFPGKGDATGLVTVNLMARDLSRASNPRGWFHRAIHRAGLTHSHIGQGVCPGSWLT